MKVFLRPWDEIMMLTWRHDVDVAPRMWWKRGTDKLMISTLGRGGSNNLPLMTSRSDGDSSAKRIFNTCHFHDPSLSINSQDCSKWNPNLTIKNVLQFLRVISLSTTLALIKCKCFKLYIVYLVNIRQKLRTFNWTYLLFIWFFFLY